MNIKAKIERLEKHSKKPGISTWVDLITYSGPWPVLVSEGMAKLIEEAKK
jgi:hypothetical protein